MLSLRNVNKVYRAAKGDVAALDAVSVDVGEGEFLVVKGPSGSGKSTMLFTMGGMLRPSTGKVICDGEDIYALGDQARSRFRAANIGFVFQLFHLVPYLNVLDNVRLAAGVSRPDSSPDRAQALLDHFQMAGRTHHKPSELSAGEKQRVAIARAILNRPKLVLADEPTGNLDPDNATAVLDGLVAYHRQGGTVVIVTHGNLADSHADRIVHLRHGAIDGDH